MAYGSEGGENNFIIKLKIYIYVVLMFLHFQDHL
jgi:hypothetical protein